jgi:hypothetical protein
VFISYDENLSKLILNSWKERNLTMTGRAQVIKTFIISQFVYTLSAVTMPDESINSLERQITNYMWQGGKPKLRSSILKQPYIRVA